MRIVKFSPQHLVSFRVQSAQAVDMKGIQDAVQHGRGLAIGMSYSLLEGDSVLACGGIIDHWRGVGSAWFLFSEQMGPQAFRMVHKRVKESLVLLLNHKYHRIQATVDPSHTEGMKWMSHLKFTCEGLAEQYSPDRRDLLIYARCRNDRS